MTPQRRGALHAMLLACLLFPGGPWFGADKVKHFLMSALIHSTTYSIARAAGVQRPGAQVTGIVGAVTIGLLKEAHDKHVGKPFSLGDLLWDGVGTATSAALLNRSH